MFQTLPSPPKILCIRFSPPLFPHLLIQSPSLINPPNLLPTLTIISWNNTSSLAANPQQKTLLNSLLQSLQSICRLSTLSSTSSDAAFPNSNSPLAEAQPLILPPGTTPPPIFC